MTSYRVCTATIVAHHFGAQPHPMHSDWYGGGPKIARTCITTGMNQDETIVELRPPRFTVQHGGRTAQVCLSKIATIKELRRKAAEALSLTADDAAGLTLVAECPGAPAMRLEKLDVTVEESLCVREIPYF